MVDLPSLPNTVPDLRAPVSRVRGAEISEPYSELANNLDKAGHELSESAARPLAKRAAATAVTRDEAGNIQIERPPIVGDAAVDYARAVRVAAVAEGESEARLRNIKLREQHRDDPEAYLTAAAQYKKGIDQTYKAAGPEVATALKQSFDRLSIETYGGLLNEKQGRDLRRASDSIAAQIQTTQNEMVALANGGDTESEDFKRRAAKVRALYGELVNNPRLAYPKERADLEQRQFDSELRAGAVGHDIARKIYDQGGPEAALRAAEQIRTDPNLQLSQAQRETLYSRALGAVQQRVTAEARIVKSLATELDDIDKIASEGFKPTTEQLSALKTAVDQTNNPGIVARYEATLQNLPIVAAWRQMSPAQLEGQLTDLDKRMRDGANPQGLALLTAGQKLLKTMRKEIVDDPLGWADRTGSVAVPPIEFAGPNAAADIRNRITAAEMVARQYAIAPTYLRPDEKQALAVVGASGGKGMLAVAQGIVDGFGARSGAVLAEVSKDAPVLAHTGGLLSGGLFGGGSASFANDVAEGLRLRQDPEAAKQLPHWAKNPSDKLYQFETARKVDQYGSAFVMIPDNGRAAEQSAKTAFTVRAMRNGYDPQGLDASSDTQRAYNRTLQEGAGATFAPDGTQYGGIATYKPGYWTNFKVLVPGTIKADRFKDVIGALRDDDLSRLATSPLAASGKPYTAADLRASVPVAVPGGYRFAQGDPASDDPKWIRGADGNAFVLNLDAVDGELRARVPGAFR